MIDIPCIIFAGGKSSRMGKDKALLPFDGHNTLTQYQLSKLSKIFNSVYISCKEKSKFDFQANFIEDTDSSVYAPTAGFSAVFEELKCESFFALSVDAPFVGEQEIQRLIDADKDRYDATIAQTAYGIQPMCGIYHRSLEREFTKMHQENNHKLGFLLKNAKTHFIHFEDEKKFLNLNNPEEYRQALQLL